MVVTFSTVGYGDIHAETDFGWVFITGVIIFMIIMIPKQTNELLKLMSIQSPYQWAVFNSKSEIPHIVITGTITLEAIKIFTKELFHEDHGN